MEQLRQLREYVTNLEAQSTTAVDISPVEGTKESKSGGGKRLGSR